MKKLTNRESEALAFIRRTIRTTGEAPTFAEIAAALGIASKSGSHRLVHSLVRRGVIEFDPRRARSITVVEPLLTPAQERCLEDISRHTGKTREELIRLAVDRLIERDGEL